MIGFLIQHNHKYEDILDRYPVTLVHNFVKAHLDSDRTKHIYQTTGLTIAICHSLDLAFNKGKGKILENYFKDMIKEVEVKPKEKGKGTRVSNSVMGFFNALPKKGE